MNTYKNFIVILAVSIFAASCDIEPVYYQQVSPDTYYDTKDAVWQRFYRPFTHARWTFGQDSNPFILQELGTDAFCSPVRGSQNTPGRESYWMHDHNFPVYFAASYHVYVSRLSGIARCWATIDDLSYVDLEKFGFTSGTWQNWKAQLSTLAGLYYLEALDCFGGMPIYFESAEEEKPRATAKETFGAIERLFSESLPYLEKKQSLGGQERGDLRQAAAALGLARLYFNAETYIGEGMYDKAAKLCQDIIEGKYGSYDLDEDWTETFGFDNSYSKEIIWSIPSERAQLETDAFYSWKNFMPANISQYFGGIPSSGGANAYCLSPSLDGTGKEYTFKLGKPFSKFEDTDVRKKCYRYLGDGKYEGMFFFGELENPDYPDWKVTGTQEYKGKTLNLVDQIARLSEGETTSDMDSGEENSGVRLVKFSPRPNAQDVGRLFNPDIPLMRLAEAYYILAECKMRNGDKKGAAELINEVRDRYFEDGIDPNPVTEANLDKWRMLDEWLIEFLGECRRRTDLLRWNEYIEGEWWDHKPDGGLNSHKKLFPISTHILDASDVIKQNPGYSDQE